PRQAEQSQEPPRRHRRRNAPHTLRATILIALLVGALYARCARESICTFKHPAANCTTDLPTRKRNTIWLQHLRPSAVHWPQNSMLFARRPAPPKKPQWSPLILGYRKDLPRLGM